MLTLVNLCRALLIAILGFAPSVNNENVCEQNLPIIQKPILFQTLRQQLTQEYQKIHYGIEGSDIQIDPKIIVLHWTATATWEETFNLFYSETLTPYRPELSGKLNVSSHFLVDRDGTIFQLMPDNWMARHVVGLNHFAIGIENVGGENGSANLTTEQVKSNAYLVCYLKKKYPQIKYLIGHKDYLKFKQTPFWLEKDPSYEPKKPDPGEDFLTRVYQLTAHLGLQSTI